ncbi:unnamed protein product [Oikopleura dioica]|uniref:Carbohydrate sulfotransferase n=1 Tax=Oikopleura dioica TaxID=34765 RepID=E4X5J9_OIKDI|nr:unnamed protein product [Oikopleura dioica]
MKRDVQFLSALSLLLFSLLIFCYVGLFEHATWSKISFRTGQYPIPSFIKRSIAAGGKSAVEDVTIDPQESIYSELAALEGTKKSVSTINIKVNSPRQKQQSSQPGQIIQFPVNDTIKDNPTFQTFQKRKEHLNFVCQRIRQVIDLNQENADNFDELDRFQKELKSSTADENVCKPITHPAGLLDNLFKSEEYKIRTCLPTKTGSTSWLRTLISLETYHGSKRPDEVHESWGSYSQKMLKNAWLLEDQVKAKTGDLRWMSLMTVRHPMARLYSAWKDKFRKGQPWLKVIEHQFKYYLLRLEQNDMSASKYEYSFEAFVELVALTDFDGQRDRHWTSIHTYCNPCAIPYEFIIKQEYGYKENDYLLQVYDQKGEFSNLKSIPKKSQWGHQIEEKPIEIEDMLEPWKEISKNTIKQIYKTFYLDFVYFDYSIDEFLAVGKEDNKSLEDVKKVLKPKMTAQSSKVKWMDTNHCRDSFDEACQFTEMAGFRLNCKGFKKFNFSTIEEAQEFACRNEEITGIGLTAGKYCVSTIEGTLTKTTEKGRSKSWIKKEHPVLISK